MNYNEPPLGFDCYLNGWGRISLKQDQTTSELRDEAKIPMLHFQPQELPALIEKLKRVIAEEVIPDLCCQNEENQALMNLLHEYLPHEPPAKKKGPRTAN